MRSSPTVPDEVIERVTLPDGGEMVLLRWDEHVAIHVNRRPLMSTHEHASEDALGELVGQRLDGIEEPVVLIGGLGIGFTLRAALDCLPETARIVVCELLPDVVRWNRGELGTFAGRPLDDPRVEVLVDDVGAVITRAKGTYDAIVLDVDNGPDALTHAANAKLYKRAGLLRARSALKPGGILTVWSAFPSATFTRWLEETIGPVDRQRTPATTPGGPRYYIWTATRS
jgi:spermidine synthase